ncbi:MAG: HNH endonuclease [Acidobacteria bacterium]|nr:HNH endonuclease [Acidobacteriota bacterium]
MFDRTWDATVRNASFEWLKAQVATYGDVLPRTLLEEGFPLDGARVPLLSPKGIFKPRVLREAPLSITTAPNGPYDDAFGPNDLLRYRYRGEDPEHPDNRGLRFAMQERLPLVYLHGLVPGRYVPAWPVFVVSDHRAGLTFTVAVDEERRRWPAARSSSLAVRDDAEDARRRYATAAVRQRLHQRAFRERVLAAYRRECAFCRFRHAELLDAAHIVPDAEEGEPVVANGLALCKLHHAAFDRNFLGVRPDYLVEVRRDLLTETDGPTLVHGIQALHGVRIRVPRRSALRPDRHRLEARYETFRRA